MKRMKKMRRNFGFTDDEFEAIPGYMQSMSRMGMRRRMAGRGKCKGIEFDSESFGSMLCGSGYFTTTHLDSEEDLRYQILELEERITWHKFRLAEIGEAISKLETLQKDEDISKTQLEREKAYLEMRKRSHEAKVSYLKRLKDLATSELESLKHSSSQ